MHTMEFGAGEQQILMAQETKNSEIHSSSQTYNFQPLLSILILQRTHWPGLTTIFDQIKKSMKMKTTRLPYTNQHRSSQPDVSTGSQRLYASLPSLNPRMTEKQRKFLTINIYNFLTSVSTRCY